MGPLGIIDKYRIRHEEKMDAGGRHLLCFYHHELWDVADKTTKVLYTRIQCQGRSQWLLIGFLLKSE